LKTETKPVAGVTLGDPAGIGPEVAVRAALHARVRRFCRPVLLGDVRIVRKVLEGLKIYLDLRTLESPEEIQSIKHKKRTARLCVLDLGKADPGKIQVGQISPQAGQAAYDWVMTGTGLAMDGIIDCLVTAPLNKEAVIKSGVEGFQGHTEVLARISKAPRHAMMLAGGGLRVVLVTTHVAIKEVSEKLSQQLILDKIELTHEFLGNQGIPMPRIAVAALNPHGGEHGVFGNEEGRIIEPAIKEAAQKGIPVIGPLPADTLFARHKREPFDAIVVMYHDQGLIPLKLLSFGKGVNVTLGLPFVRTSPDHGTAFDLAGKGMSDPRSMIEALCLAGTLAQRGYGRHSDANKNAEGE
jgi:4-hydroxythreonine-4-phosphate dehydrogenase